MGYSPWALKGSVRHDEQLSTHICLQGVALVIWWGGSGWYKDALNIARCVGPLVVKRFEERKKKRSHRILGT